MNKIWWSSKISINNLGIISRYCLYGYLKLVNKIYFCKTYIIIIGDFLIQLNDIKKTCGLISDWYHSGGWE